MFLCCAASKKWSRAPGGSADLRAAEELCKVGLETGDSSSSESARPTVIPAHFRNSCLCCVSEMSLCSVPILATTAVWIRAHPRSPPVTSTPIEQAQDDYFTLTDHIEGAC
jgi:hypothetical protein